MQWPQVRTGRALEAAAGRVTSDGCGLMAPLLAAAERAAQRITEAQRAELEELLVELSSSEGSDDLEALMILDAQVHRFIYRCAANPYLEETLGRYFNLSIRIWHLVLDRLPHLFARVHEHDDVLRAIAAGDAQRARDILAAHIATFEREIRAVI